MRTKEELEAFIAELDPLSADADTIRDAELELRTLIDRESGRLLATERYAIDSEGREYVINIAGYAEPDPLSDNPGDMVRPGSDMQGWEEQCYSALVAKYEHQIPKLEIFGWWVPIRKQYADLSDALDALNEKIANELVERSIKSDLPMQAHGCPWDIAPEGAFEDICVDALSLGIDANQVSVMRSQVLIAQGCEKDTLFSNYTLRLAVERFYALREMEQVKSVAQSACGRITVLRREQKQKLQPKKKGKR
jgi:hypothetical protein